MNLQVRRVALIGGSGFVGRSISEHLARAGIEQKVLTRARLHARASWPLPGASCVECDPCSPEALAAAVRDCDAVINLVGILNERGGALQQMVGPGGQQALLIGPSLLSPL